MQRPEGRLHPGAAFVAAALLLTAACSCGASAANDGLGGTGKGLHAGLQQLQGEDAMYGMTDEMTCINRTAEVNMTVLSDTLLTCTAEHPQGCCEKIEAVYGKNGSLADCKFHGRDLSHLPAAHS
eukprot:evm.model.scf_433.2 EVM.evm.TU.scf_433.2   scf_433:32953-35125(+)